MDEMDAKISSKHICFATHMLDSDDGRITDSSFIMDQRMGVGFFSIRLT
jgi:hypothetical protein